MEDIELLIQDRKVQMDPNRLIVVSRLDHFAHRYY